MERGMAELLRYNHWANRSLFDACASVPDEQLAATQPPTSESIAELLTHLVGAQENYVHWLRGETFQSALDRHTDWPGLDAVSRAGDVTSEALIAVAATLPDEAEVDLWHHGAMHRYPVGYLLANVIEHGIRHRTEVVRLLSTLSLPVPDLDGWSYGRSVGRGSIVR